MFWTAPASGADASGYGILGLVVVLYVIYRVLVKRSKPLRTRRPKY
jgi:hypothetical protein